MTLSEQDEVLPPEPGTLEDMTCGLPENPVMDPSPVDDSVDDGIEAELNDYDNWPEPDDEEDS